MLFGLLDEGSTSSKNFFRKGDSMKKRNFGSAGMVFVIAAMMILGMGSVVQAEYPESPISMIVTYSPGGATDFQARIVTMMAGDAHVRHHYGF